MKKKTETEKTWTHLKLIITINVKWNANMRPLKTNNSIAKYIVGKCLLIIYIFLTRIATQAEQKNHNTKSI